MAVIIVLLLGTTKVVWRYAVDCSTRGGYK